MPKMQAAFQYDGVVKTINLPNEGAVSGQGTPTAGLLHRLPGITVCDGNYHVQVST